MPRRHRALKKNIWKQKSNVVDTCTSIYVEICVGTSRFEEDQQRLWRLLLNVFGDTEAKKLEMVEFLQCTFWYMDRKISRQVLAAKIINHFFRIPYTFDGENLDTRAKSKTGVDSNSLEPTTADVISQLDALFKAKLEYEKSRDENKALEAQLAKLEKKSIKLKNVLKRAEGLNHCPNLQPPTTSQVRMPQSEFGDDEYKKKVFELVEAMWGKSSESLKKAERYISDAFRFAMHNKSEDDFLSLLDDLRIEDSSKCSANADVDKNEDKDKNFFSPSALSDEENLDEETVAVSSWTETCDRRAPWLLPDHGCSCAENASDAEYNHGRFMRIKYFLDASNYYSFIINPRPEYKTMSKA